MTNSTDFSFRHLTQEGNLPTQTCLSAPHNCGHAMFLPPGILNGCSTPVVIFLSSPNCPPVMFSLAASKLWQLRQALGIHCVVVFTASQQRLISTSRAENDQLLPVYESSSDFSFLLIFNGRPTGVDRLTENRCRHLIFAVGRRKWAIVIIVVAATPQFCLQIGILSNHPIFMQFFLFKLATCRLISFSADT